METLSSKIFLSHAVADKPLVEAFETLLSKSFGILSSDIFCSSLEGQGVSKGGGFVDEIHQQIKGAKAVVALISPAYLDSAFCMAELGGAWALNSKRLPIIVPPNDFTVMSATLLGIVGVKIDDEDALLQGFEEISSSISGTLPTVGVRSRATRDFLKTWKSIKGDVQAASRVEEAVHAVVKSERDKAIEERDNAENELLEMTVKMEALRKAKDKKDVQKIDVQFSNENWREKFENELDVIRSLYAELGGYEIARLLILEALGKKGNLDENNYPDETTRATELDVYYPESKEWNFANADVKILMRSVESTVNLFQDDLSAGQELDDEGEKSDPTHIRFWEEHL